MKTCSNCKEAFPATPEYFHRTKLNKDGLQYQCKKCKRQYYLDNKKRIRARCKQYYLCNKEKVKQWAEDNKEKIAARKKQYNLNRLRQLHANNKFNPAHMHEMWERGEVYKDKQGYYRYTLNDQLVHRWIMENHMRRDISNEVIHHINGNKQDNRIQNLHLTKWDEHGKYHEYEWSRSLYPLKSV